MSKPDVVLDPDGDLLVILRNPSSIFDSHPELEPSEPESESDTAIGSDSTEDPEHIDHPDWLFKASSKHLSLACPRFKKMMDGPWLEATQVHEDGLRHWVVEGFDVFPMFYVLCIIHGKHRQVPLRGLCCDVPSTVELNMLVELSRIVDYIECHEVIELFADNWIRGLEINVPKSYNTELIFWICIAGVFGKDEIFKRCTRLAIVESHSGIPTFGLPILPDISDEIDRRRISCLDRIFARVYDTVNDLTTKDICSPKCDATRLGVLARYMHANSLSPRPTSPYTRLSVSWAVKTLSRLPDFYRGSSERSSCEPKAPESESTVSGRSSPLDLQSDYELAMTSLGLHCGFSELIYRAKFVEWITQGLDIECLKRTQLLGVQDDENFDKS
ncbi:hypothetical protein F4680DRAFT_468159 [Xylaria scruposa]|nr:hypothetical protein F4680DRAFT_468159 [Xylaria scruposa]